MTTISECTCKGARKVLFDKSTHEMLCARCGAPVIWREDDDADDLPF